MKKRLLTLPEMFLIAGTRVALGAGAGLLLAEKFGKKRRKSIGRTLLLAGAASTIPLAIKMLGKR
jgi:hypothetical protein